MYDTFKEKEQYNILMDKLQTQNKEYIRLKNSECLQKEIMRKRVKYSLRHLDVGMIKRYLKHKVAVEKLRHIEEKKHYHMPTMKTLSISPNYYSNERIAVYTAVFGGYDWIHEPVVLPDNVDYYMITDTNEFSEKSLWKNFDASMFKKYTDNLDAGMRNRWYKTHPHLLFPDYQYSLYVDSSIKIITDVTEHINKIGKNSIAIHRHPDRDCVYDELDVVKCFGKDNTQNLIRTERMYREINFPKHYGLLENTIIARKHNEKNVISVMEDWWKYIERYSKRDQLSLPVVLREHGIKVEEVCGLGNDIKKNYAFRWEAHMGYYDRVKD